MQIRSVLDVPAVTAAADVSSHWKPKMALKTGISQFTAGSPVASMLREIQSWYGDQDDAAVVDEILIGKPTRAIPDFRLGIRTATVIARVNGRFSGAAIARF